MYYYEMRRIAKTGDVLLVEGTGFVSGFIRAFTGESLSHIALLFWMQEGLFVAEMVEGTGYRILPASQWFAERAKDKVFFGLAPKVVEDFPDITLRAISEYRANKKLQKYGYLSLVKVWLAQHTGRTYKLTQKVCSTFVQDVWVRCGFTFTRTPDPGDYLVYCQGIHPVISDPEAALQAAPAGGN